MARKGVRVQVPLAARREHDHDLDHTKPDDPHEGRRLSWLVCSRWPYKHPAKGFDSSAAHEVPTPNMMEHNSVVECLPDAQVTGVRFPLLQPGHPTLGLAPPWEVKPTPTVSNVMVAGSPSKGAGAGSIPGETVNSGAWAYRLVVWIPV